MSVTTKDLEDLAQALNTLHDIQAEYLDAAIHGKIPAVRKRRDGRPLWAVAAETVEEVLQELPRHRKGLAWVKEIKEILIEGAFYYEMAVRALKSAEERRTWGKQWTAAIEKRRMTCHDGLAKLAEEISASANQEAPVTIPTTIIAYGHKRYGVGHEVQVVTDAEDAVLTAFLDHKAMDYPRLKELGGEAGPKVLRALTTNYNGLFAPAIRLPGVKGRGGYQVHIRQARSGS
jgi:hypothetical protein